MKTLKLIGITMMLSICACIDVTRVYASENSNSSLVTYDIAKDKTYRMDIFVSTGGTLFEGNDKVSSGLTTYEQPLESTREFTIHPDKGYKLYKITYDSPEFKDSKDITGEVKNGKIKISNVSTHMQITFTFVRVDDEASNDDIVSNSPLTGDMNRKSIYFPIAVFTLTLIWIAIKCKLLVDEEK